MSDMKKVLNDWDAADELLVDKIEKCVKEDELKNGWIKYSLFDSTSDTSFSSGVFDVYVNPITKSAMLYWDFKLKSSLTNKVVTLSTNLPSKYAPIITARTFMLGATLTVYITEYGQVGISVGTGTLEAEKQYKGVLNWFFPQR